MTATKPPVVDAVAYGEFVAGLELTHIWLVSAEIRNNTGPMRPETVHVSAEGVDTSLSISPGGFFAHQKFEVTFVEDAAAEPSASIQVEFGLAYTTEIELTDTLSETFITWNLPLNVWPYFREFVASMTGRMGWDNYTMPAFKAQAPRLRIEQVDSGAALDEQDKTPEAPISPKKTTRKPRETKKFIEQAN